MKNMKKLAAITIAAGGLAVAGAGVASAHGGATAGGAVKNSPGVVSGNAVQVPVHVPVNACGNSVSVVGLLNPVFGNTCLNR
ncbi:chaplin [Streptomyces varsoviensis]|uniref:Chaplin n=1 Tax=Streptomyces varsoviensis TaxID=67373 RepID=A0ABR5J7J1_9ACTN|nr:chaplin [Streptomyces varsoviensis]KOG89431.1 chaplin [Streptomyces varsoviensis]